MSDYAESMTLIRPELKDKNHIWGEAYFYIKKFIKTSNFASNKQFLKIKLKPQ